MKDLEELDLFKCGIGYGKKCDLELLKQNV